jgi:hypothetical protein
MKDIDDLPLWFGKWKGYTPNEVAEEEPGYVVWMYENVTPIPCSKWLAEACMQDDSDNDDDYGLDPRDFF